MAQQVDLIIHNAAQIATCASSGRPKRGATLKDVGLISTAAVAIHKGVIKGVGSSAEILNHYTAPNLINAAGQAIVPGFVDCHTHTVFGGDRVHEFEMRIRGASYMDIMAAGGGIVSTMVHTRQESTNHLIQSASQRLDQMFSLGSTTVEIKTGYGLDTVNELKMLEVIAALDQQHPCRIVPTFLGAHTLPPEYKDKSNGYVDLVIDEMIPAVAEWYQSSHFAAQNVPFFIDVFCENHAFDITQTRRILEAGLTAGLRGKIHVDQFNSLGGLDVALDLDLTSADHLEVTTEAGIERLSQSETAAVVLPAVNFNLGLTNFAGGRALADAGSILALGTDMNPGSAPCFSMPLTMAIACRYMRLEPAEALNAATINAAYALGLSDKIGSIEAGKAADLLILRCDDYRNLTYLLGDNKVQTIIKNGKII